MNLPETGRDRLRIDLQEVAGEYRPDPAAIAKRTAAGRAAAARRDRMRPVAAAVGVLGVVAAIAVGVQMSDEPDAPPVAAVAPPASVPTSRPAKPSADKAPPRKKTSFMSCAGSIDKHSVPTWTQSTVTMRTTKRVADLEVAITVARTAGARPAGRFTTAPNGDVDVSVDETADALIYRFTLKDGAHLAAGTWVFAAQFDHRTGRDRRNDSYVVDAGDASKAGNFSGN